MKRKTHICPCCRFETNTIHDYRTQRIKRDSGDVHHQKTHAIVSFLFSPDGYGALAHLSTAHGGARKLSRAPDSAIRSLRLRSLRRTMLLLGDILLPTKKTPIRVFLVVEEDGFEPSKLSATDLQSAPFGHSGTPPYSSKRVGAGDGTRTRNLLITNQLLCQLSYTSVYSLLTDK